MGGSDLYLTTGAPPSAKFSGEMRALADAPLSPGQTRALAYEALRNADSVNNVRLKIKLARDGGATQGISGLSLQDSD